MLQEAVQENQGLPVKIVLLPVGSKDTNPAYVYQQSGSVERGRRQRDRASRDERVHMYFEFLFFSMPLCLFIGKIGKIRNVDACGIQWDARMHFYVSWIEPCYLAYPAGTYLGGI